VTKGSDNYTHAFVRSFTAWLHFKVSGEHCFENVSTNKHIDLLWRISVLYTAILFFFLVPVGIQDVLFVPLLILLKLIRFLLVKLIQSNMLYKEIRFQSPTYGVYISQLLVFQTFPFLSGFLWYGVAVNE
jgi:hypothetical protein